MVTFLLGALLALSVVAEELASTYQVDNLSPKIIYDPPMRGGLESGNTSPVWVPYTAENAWNSSFVDRPYQKHKVNQLDWPHYTWAKWLDNMTAPSASMTFYGRAVTVVGPPPGRRAPDISGGGAVHVEIDGKVWGNCTDQMGELQTRCYFGFPADSHNVTIRLAWGAFALDHFEVAVGEEEQGPVQVPCANDTSLNSGGQYALTWGGEWQAKSESAHPDVNGQSNWTRAVTNVSGSFVSINIPKGTSRVVVLGATDVDHGRYHAVITGPSGVWADFETDTFNAQAVQGIPILYRRIEPTGAHTMKVTNLAPDGAFLEISEIQFFSDKYTAALNETSGLNSTGAANGSAVSSGKDEPKGGGISGGAIAGIVIGCIAGVAIAAVLGWLLWRRRRKQVRTSNEPIDMWSDNGDDIDDTVEPFQEDPKDANAAMMQTGRPATLVSQPSPTRPSAARSQASGDSSQPLIRHDSSALEAKGTPPATAETAVAAPAAPPVEPVAASAAPPVALPRHVHHTDGGAVALPQTEPIEETPPTYNPDWAAVPGVPGPISVSSSSEPSLAGPSSQSGQSDPAVPNHWKAAILAATGAPSGSTSGPSGTSAAADPGQPRAAHLDLKEEIIAAMAADASASAGSGSPESAAVSQPGQSNRAVPADLKAAILAVTSNTPPATSGFGPSGGVGGEKS